MIVLKATQEKVLAVLQSVVGILERRRLSILGKVIAKTEDFHGTDSGIPSVLLHAPEQRENSKWFVRESVESPQRMTEEIEQLCARVWASCWRLIADSGTRKLCANL